ncbi:MAG: PH domain-containing protein [Clostridia bacterium]|nr:PH domain-containing protein [Clostridia bacterium]
MLERTYVAHPLMMINIMKPFLFVLVLPVVKGVLQYFITGRITGVLTLEIAAFAVVGVLSFLSFRSFKVVIDDKKLVIQKGFLIKSVAVIKKERLSCVSFERGIFDLMFASGTYKVNTEAGASGKTDFSFKLRLNDAVEMSKFLYGEENRVAVRFNAFKSAIFAAATSSAITGLLVGVPIINNSGKILGIALSRILFDEINRASARFDAYFPPIVNVITVTLIFGYALSFVIGFIRMLGFRLRIGEKKAEVEYGVISRRRVIFKKSAVNDVCIEQTPLMRAFGLFSMRAAVGGYGDKKGEKAIIVPAARRFRIKNQFRAYFPFLCPKAVPIRAERTKTNALRALWPARFAAAIDICFTTAMSICFPSVLRFFVASGIVVMAVIVYYGNLCFLSYKTGKLCISKSVSAFGFFGLTTRELYCDKQRIGEIKIIRTPADRRYNTCKAEITVCSESADKVKVRNIDYRKTLDFVRQEFGTDE